MDKQLLTARSVSFLAILVTTLKININLARKDRAAMISHV